ncbi:unnamed protein product [Rotaria sp. Silwood1]|nr:unnamed protein product [Rotaria sp. Silwood1]CAF1338681.1 unnamed protein product [Rotaria sp. Silwood1]CAF3552771.1 unnamed protein product [Rotaria sp. Silwood1]CAF3568914.1 unnamed protein product [Rotaria sp. Silwood1]CAF3582918.1 unnamed protein product [Rotaria sp. Silwood1]
MNVILTDPCRWLPDSTNEENEIRGIFFHHWEQLKDRFIATVNDINKWRETFIDYVNKYAEEQIRILAEDFQRQRLNLDEKREENIDTTRAYSAARNIELFQELRNECRLLEFQVAQLEFITGEMQGLKVITVVEQMERKKKEKFTTSKSENDKLEEKSITEHPNDIQATHSLPVESSNDDNRSINGSNTSKEHNLSDKDVINKCPICLMIFPFRMKYDDRSQHIREHCTDD